MSCVAESGRTAQAVPVVACLNSQAHVRASGGK